jgi:ADP-L-glycero-D-manno-heptose 6-epimerase
MIIITGAAGFIGSALVWALNERDRKDIILVDRLGNDERWKNLVPLRYMDYLEKDDFLKVILEEKNPFPGTEAVLHMGDCSDTTETDASMLIKNNFEYSKHLARWCVRNDVRFVYASSAATYGDGMRGYDDDEEFIDSLRPLNMYGYSKQVFDQWALNQNLFRKIVGLKYFNVYGPNEYHKGDMRSVALKAFEQIQKSGKVRLFKSYNAKYKDGEQMRDFLYIKDAVDITLFFLNQDIPGGIYNIGTGEARTWLDMMRALFRELKLEIKIDFIDMPENLREKYQYFTQAEIGKLQTAGYDQDISSLEKGISNYVKYLTKGYQHLGA